ncbi:quinon protein alcohol dehydrogenase-like superfamily [Abortiporus biennis]|nr:quinon protein alcohol dehydrogenase-like superfamily [Abortiporus biennis]
MTAVVKNNFAARQRERTEKCTNYIATNEDFKLGGVDSRTQSLIDEATILLPGASAPRQWQSRVLLDPTMGGGAPGVTSLSKDGLFFGMTVEDDTIRGWNLDMDLMVYKLDGDMEGMTTVSCFSPDGKSFVSTVGSLVDIWDLSQGKQSGKIEYSELVTGVAWSPNGLLIATASSNEINIWDGEGDHENLLKIPTIEALSMVQSVTFIPDSTKLIVNSEKQVFIWDVKTGDFIGKLQGHENVIWGLDVSQDSGRIVTGSEDHSCRVWKAATGDELVTMHYHTGPVWSVAFSPDGKRVVSGSHDTITVISDAYTGEKIYALSTKTSTVINSVAYSLDGDVVITGSADGSVRVWDARRGKFEAELRGHEDKVRTLLFTPDGKDFISCSDDGTVRVWNLADILRFAI